MSHAPRATLRAASIKFMKISSFFAYFVPELRGRSGPQLMKLWSTCAPCSQNWVYLHLLLILACCSLIFNFIIHLSAAPLSMLFALLLGLTIPANIYFYAVFNNRRQVLRQYIEENWEEFRPER